MKKNFKMPTILGIILILLGTVGGVFLVKEGQRFTLHAGPTSFPKQVKITNITDKGFSVSWITEKEDPGFIKYGTSSDIPFLVTDDRDQTAGGSGKYPAHHITVGNLKPATTYYFKLGSGARLFDNNGQLYQVTTAPSLRTPPTTTDVAYGAIVDQNGGPVEGAIIYLSLANATALSALSKPSGGWMIPLNLARSADLASYVTYDRQASVLEIFVQMGSSGTSTAVVTTRNDSPVPTIVLGQNHDFRSGTVSGSTPLPTAATSSASQFSPPPLASPSPELKILNPDEGEAINSQKPEFYGTGPAGGTLTIEVLSSRASSGSIQIDSAGNWRWTSPVNLEPGEHALTVRLPNGTAQTRSFVVLAAETSQLPAQTATTSATATPFPSPTLTPSPTPAEAGRVSLPSTTAGTLTPGNLTPTLCLFIIGITLLLTGLFFEILQKTRKQDY